MKPILIEEAPTKVIVKYDSIPFELPLNIREQHQQFWNEEVKINPHFRNGEVFTTTEIYKSPNELQVLLDKHNKSILEKGDLPEFNEFLLVSLDKESVHSFLQNDLSLKEEYLEPILKKYISN